MKHNKSSNTKHLVYSGKGDADNVGELCLIFAQAILTMSKHLFLLSVWRVRGIRTFVVFHFVLLFPPSASTLSASPEPEEDQVLRRCQHLLCQKKTKFVDVVNISCARRRPSASTLSASPVQE
jgi:hypothetical protein